MSLKPSIYDVDPILRKCKPAFTRRTLHRDLEPSDLMDSALSRSIRLAALIPGGSSGYDDYFGRYFPSEGELAALPAPMRAEAVMLAAERGVALANSDKHMASVTGLVSSSASHHSDFDFSWLISGFAADCLVTVPAAYVVRSDLRSALQIWCGSNSYKLPPDQAFGHAMRAVGGTPKRQRIEGVRRHVWSGVGFTELGATLALASRMELSNG